MSSARRKRSPRPGNRLAVTGWDGLFAVLFTAVFFLNLGLRDAYPMSTMRPPPLPRRLGIALVITGLAATWFWARVGWLLRNALRVRTQAVRSQARQCVHCGYDLRASRGICPECGAAVPIVAYIALGSNLGDRELSLKRALDLLSLIRGVEVTAVSSSTENPAVGGPPDSPPFLNAAAEVETTLAADKLLEALLETERKMGRVRRERWGPRIIDLDLLFYGDQTVSHDDLTIPHPRLHERRFVLGPLAEIAPQLVHPVLKKTVAQLLAELP